MRQRTIEGQVAWVVDENMSTDERLEAAWWVATAIYIVFWLMDAGRPLTAIPEPITACDHPPALQRFSNVVRHGKSTFGRVLNFRDGENAALSSVFRKAARHAEQTLSTARHFPRPSALLSTLDNDQSWYYSAALANHWVSLRERLLPYSHAARLAAGSPWPERRPGPDERNVVRLIRPYGASPFDHERR